MIKLVESLRQATEECKSHNEWPLHSTPDSEIDRWERVLSHYEEKKVETHIECMVHPLIWRNVFETKHGRYGHIDYASDTAAIAGYPYFTWNDRIFTSPSARDTGFTVDDVQ